MDEQYRLPLGLCKQAFMKLESFRLDAREIAEDPDLEPDERETFKTMADLAATMQAHISNIVQKEMGEEEFLAEEVPMDAIEPYPDDSAEDIMDESIE